MSGAKPSRAKAVGIALLPILLGLTSCTSPFVIFDRQTAEIHAARTLDDFHDAAAKADEERYFSHFAPDAVFLGTDDTERWTVEEFRAFARPFFSQGKGWTYTAVERNVVLSKDGRIAWFDEKLDNAKWGRCRGSGVLVFTTGRWLVAQYNLTVPIPNDLLPEVAERIREFEASK